MGIFAKSEKISVAIDPELADKINARIPRNLKLSVLVRWLLMGLVLTPQEIAKFCKDNEEEAHGVQPYITEALQKIFTGAELVAKKEKKHG